jgi:Flp pilus assembly protein TadD
MSWSRGIQGATGSGGAFITLRPIAARIDAGSPSTPATAAAQPAIGDGPTPADPAAERQQAREAYHRGAPREATTILTRLIATATAMGAVQADDHLFLGLTLSAEGRIAEAIVTLRAGLARFPSIAALHENLGVLLLAADQPAEAIAACEQALALGSDSPNVLDCLTDASARIGRFDLAVVHGRQALEAKDRMFGGRPRLTEVPPTPPAAFNPSDPAGNVIAYSLWGNEPRYHVPLLENARILQHLFPGWTMRVYHDATVDPAYLEHLRARGVALRPMALPPGLPVHRKLLWRFDVAADPSVRRFLCRDADSLLTVKERVAVDAWLASAFPFHAMRDWYTHTDLLLAGMWGGVGGILPPVETLLTAYHGWRVEHDHVDQDMLSETVWPILRGHVLIHDSIFAPCLGSVPFPPFGALPAGMHIGQNAFLHFRLAE